MSDILNETLLRLSQLSPVEIDLLLKAGKEMQKTAARDALCKENEPDMDTEGLCLENLD